MSNTMKAGDNSSIPAPLRDWLDNAILSQMTDSQAATDNTMRQKVSIANAILYPLENKPRKAKAHRA